jgi:ubiquinone/menaquinone biosynthesis C-methylase UbiE
MSLLNEKRICPDTESSDMQSDFPKPTQDKIDRERIFHNEWAKSVKIAELLVRESFESPSAFENAYALKAMGDLRGKRLLDLGCGAGEASVYLALRGAEVHACDIAEDILSVAASLAIKFGVKLRLTQAEASHLPYDDEYFDIVYGHGVLHHVELVPTAKEIKRVLKGNGKAIFIEPLPYNPAIILYRRMAKDVRTEDERPLSFRQLDNMRPFFAGFSHKEFWLLSLMIFFHFYFVRRLDPSKVRYWKKVIEEGQSYEKTLRKLQRVDDILLGALPFMRYLCWITVIVATK